MSPWTRLTVAADNMHLASVSLKPGFTVDTAYLVPGSVAEDSARSGDVPQFCLMFTTINFVMNVARVFNSFITTELAISMVPWP